MSDLSVLLGYDIDENSEKQAVNSIQALSQKMALIGAGMSAAFTAPLTLIGQRFKNLARDAEESLNKVRVSFGESSKEVEDFAKTTLDRFGIARGTTLELASTFGDMATSMGLSQEEAAKMSTSLVGLAGDLSSFKNIGIAQAQTALNGVFTGETESLKLLGFVMTEATLQAFALEQGINKKVSAMTQAEKVQLRYAYIMQVSANAHGDYARTVEGAANQERKLEEQQKEIGETMGAILLPMYTKVITKVNELATMFNNLDDGVKTNIVIFGGLLAAVGPVLTTLGALGLMLPVLKAGFLALVSPVGLVGIAIAAVTGIAIDHYITVNRLKEATEDLETVNKRISNQYYNEIATVGELVDIIRDEKSTKEQLLKAKKHLIAIDPTFAESLKNESINFALLTDTVDSYIKKLTSASKAKLLQSKIDFNIEYEQKILNDPFSDLSVLDKLQMGAAGIMKSMVQKEGEVMDALAHRNFVKITELREATKSFANELKNLNLSEITDGSETVEEKIKKLSDAFSGSADSLDTKGSKGINAVITDLDRLQAKVEQFDIDSIDIDKMLEDITRKREGSSFDQMDVFKLGNNLKLQELAEQSGKEIGAKFNESLTNAIGSHEINIDNFEVNPFDKFMSNLQEKLGEGFAAIIRFQESAIMLLGDAMSTGLAGVFNKDIKFDFKKMLGSFLKSMGQMFMSIAAQLLVAHKFLSVATWGANAPNLIAAAKLLGVGVAMSAGGMALSSSGSPSESGAYNNSFTGANFGNVQIGGNVKFEIQGTSLVGVLNNTNMQNG